MSSPNPEQQGGETYLNFVDGGVALDPALGGISRLPNGQLTTVPPVNSDTATITKPTLPQVSTTIGSERTTTQVPTGGKQPTDAVTSSDNSNRGDIMSATESDSNNKKNTAAIAGGVIGAVIGIILVAIAIFIYLRMRKRKKNRAAKELLPYSSVSGSPIIDENKYPSVSEAPIKAAAAPIAITTNHNNHSRNLDSPLPPPPPDAYPQSIHTSYTNSPTTDQATSGPNKFYDPTTSHIGQAITTDSPHLLQQTSPIDNSYPQYLNTDYTTNNTLATTNLQRADTTVSGRTDISRNDLDRSVSQNTAITAPTPYNGGAGNHNDPPSPVLSITMPHHSNEPNHLRLDENRSPSPVYGDEESRGLFEGRRREQEVPRLPIYDRSGDRGSAL